jgi:hypothetical protein
MKDEAGPLWLLLESFLESLPVRPWVFALALLTPVSLVVACIYNQAKA